LLFSDLSVVTQQLLWGSLLGDGCVRIGTGRKGQVSRNYHFYEGHSCAQRAYCDWKRRLLKEFHTTALSPHKRGVEFSTCSSPIFTRLRQEFYGRESHKHIIPADVKRGLNLFGLLIWYLDDGTMGYHSMDKLPRAGKTPSFSIATHSWRLEDLLEFCTDFNARFSTQLYCKTYKWKDTTTRIIKINKLSRDFLLPEWVKIKKDYSIPADIDYKLLIGK
ncbi:hypothetical protein KC963_03815, partial [Candidatus Saccharibacteria bacterium]|nr:hypothetical protein [Candidatus Saccharibacteria bacterium]